MCVIFASHAPSLQRATGLTEPNEMQTSNGVKNGSTKKLKQSASETNTNLLIYDTEIQNVSKEIEVQKAMPTPQQLKDAST